MFDAEMFITEGFRTAIRFKTPVFLVDYWKGRETKAPLGAKDFAEAIEYINNNSSKFGIHKNHIAVGGAGAGGWVVLGAMLQLIKRNNIDIVDTAFYISPIVDDVLGRTEDKSLALWEEKWKSYSTGFFEMMANDIDKQSNDSNLYPLRGTKAELKKMPPSVIFTAEFDYLHRDAEMLR